MTDSQTKGLVFNIQKFSVHDGEGIRTLVFLKGCPLRCRWCSNPESQKREAEHAFNPMRCITAAVCGYCAKSCTTGAISIEDGLVRFDPLSCAQCFQCATVCPSGAQSVYGEQMTVGAVLDRVAEDGVFYNRSHGGITLSGGEALMQHEFALALLREARHRHIHSTIETCGCVPYEHLQEACRNLNALIYDLKCANPVLHKQYTGVDNSLIVENFQQICRDFPDLPIRARTPVIPGFNDNEDEIISIRKLIPNLPNVEYELLPYHRMGQPKYAYLGRRYEMDDVKIDEEKIVRLRTLAGAL